MMTVTVNAFTMLAAVGLVVVGAVALWAVREAMRELRQWIEMIKRGR